MRVLVACEESQTVCVEFRKLGHEAFSCDIQDCSGGHPEWHIKGDAIQEAYSGKYDLMIAHPPCTYLSYAGIGWFDVKKYGEKAIERHKNKDEAIEFFLKLWNAPIEKICIENPRGFAQMVIKPTQLIHPYYFGDSFSKSTLLWLKNLKPLHHVKDFNLFGDEPTHVDKGVFRTRITKDGRVKSEAVWYADAVSLPPAERAKVRSKTFPGIAKAMATQWGD
jgi:hypothetical protein